MFTPDQYQLIDFGEGEKLELFAGQSVRRPAPVANDNAKLNRDSWLDSIRYDRDSGWDQRSDSIDQVIENRGMHFSLSATPTGQVGIFPEQVFNWDWILDCESDLSGLKAINLFGYTGGTTLALAKRGVKVTHVDSANSVVQWARRNAELSGLGDAPIRWICEDAIRFLQREIKRGNKYDIVVADPPSFGRGPKKEVWKIQRDLPQLVGLLNELCEHECSMAVLSCHTPEFSFEDLAQLVRGEFGLSQNIGEAFELSIPSKLGARELLSGDCFRFNR